MSAPKLSSNKNSNREVVKCVFFFKTMHRMMYAGVPKVIFWCLEVKNWKLFNFFEIKLYLQIILDFRYSISLISQKEMLPNYRLLNIRKMTGRTPAYSILFITWKRKTHFPTSWFDFSLEFNFESLREIQTLLWPFNQ